MIFSVLTSLEAVKSEVGTVDGELVGKEVTHQYEKQEGEDDDGACFQPEWCLERGDVV
jgi:hypothetical protein